MKSSSSHSLKDLHKPSKRAYSFSDKENRDANFRQKQSREKGFLRQRPQTAVESLSLKVPEESKIVVISEDPKEVEGENKDFAFEKAQSETAIDHPESTEAQPTSSFGKIEEIKEHGEIIFKKKNFEFKPFNLMTEVRSRERKTQSFYTPAAPVRNDRKRNANETGVFNLQTEIRGVQKKLEWEQELKKNEDLEKAIRLFKAQPLPNYEEMRNEFLNKNASTPKPLNPQVFNLKTEIRGVQKKLEWDQELKKNEDLEKAIRLFKAQPLPNYEEMRNEFLNKNVPTPKATQILPIQLRTDERALKSLHKPIELPKEEPPFEFKAKEAPDFSRLFFNPRPLSPRKSIDFSEFSLFTSKRAQKRDENDIMQKERLDFIEKREKEQQRLKEEEEKKELDNFRKELNFKAQPIRKFKLNNVERNEKKLTLPVVFQFRETVSKCKY